MTTLDDWRKAAKAEGFIILGNQSRKHSSYVKYVRIHLTGTNESELKINNSFVQKITLYMFGRRVQMNAN